jgi:NAD(P)-dependent dehydrogenase (short-subunit alcohol dehydrogenase family)
MERVAIVTGAAGNLGRALAARLAADGFTIVAIGHGAAERLPPAALALGEVDLGDEASTVAALARVGARFDRVTALVNAAGGFAWERVADGSAASWERLYRLNVLTALNMARAALPLLGAGGAIVNVGALGAARAGEGMGAYAAAKSGVLRLTEALAAELRERRIRVNAVLPSVIDTPANRADMPESDFAAWVTPAELANVIAFLVSDQASGITGAAIPVSGRI